tara:strand:+ start:6441 stop:7865 length:1425 start_codon:yes stop_codon:yes gene_type:complete
MAVEVVQAPNEMVIPAYSDIVFTVKDTGTGTLAEMLAARFKFVCDVYVNSEKVARLKVSPNKNKIGVFDISKVVQDYVQETRKAGKQSLFEQTVQTHVIHNTDKYSRNDNTIVKVEVLFGQEFLFLENLTQFNGFNNAGAPALTVKNTNVSQQGARYFYKIFNGCTQFTDGFEAFDVSTYINNNANDLLLTKFPDYASSGLSQNVRLTDYHTMARFDSQSNDQFTALDGTTENSTGRYIQIKQYNSADSLLATNSYVVSSGNGAALEEGEFSIVGRTPMNLLYFGAGAKNIDNSNIALNASTAYYEITVVNASGTAKSKTYRFTIQDEDCKGFETVRLCWLNTFGTWDYYNFTKRSTRVTNVKRNQFRKNVGNWQDASETVNWTYNTFEGGKGVYSVDASKTIEANTDYITETEATFLEELFTSPSVMFYAGSNNWVTANVTESSYTKQTKVNDKLIQYVLNIELGHKTVVQNR